MRLIDPDGRLFGRFNVIDVMAVLFVLTLAQFASFGYRLSVERKAQAAVAALWKPITVRQRMELETVRVAVHVPDAEREALALMRPGDRSLDSPEWPEWPPSTLLSIARTPAPLPSLWQRNKPRSSDDLLLTFRVPCQWEESSFRYLGQPLELGSFFRFEAAGYVLEGRVVRMEWVTLGGAP